MRTGLTFTRSVCAHSPASSLLSCAGCLQQQARSFPSPVLLNAVFNSVEKLLRKLLSEIEQAGFGNAPELQQELEAARAYLQGGTVAY